MLSNEKMREAIDSIADAARVLRGGINGAQTLVGILSECLDELSADIQPGDEDGLEFDDDALAAMTRQRDTLMGKLLREGAEHEKAVRELGQKLRAEAQRREAAQRELEHRSAMLDGEIESRKAAEQQRDDARALALSSAYHERAIELAKLWGVELNEGTHERAHQVCQRIKSEGRVND